MFNIFDDDNAGLGDFFVFGWMMGLFDKEEDDNDDDYDFFEDEDEDGER
jgi:hypothetical protein